MNRTPHARPLRVRRTRSSVRALALFAPAALVLASCGGDDDTSSDTADVTSDVTTEDTMVEDTTEDTMVEDTTEDTMVEDTTEDTTDGTTQPDSEAVDVLTDTLAGEGVDTFLSLLPLVGFDEVTDADQITIFAPSDEAFTSVAADELAGIVEDPQSVIDVLQAHVVEGLVTSGDLQDTESVQPIRGEAVPVSVDGDTVMVGEANVVTADIEFAGGIVHVIDDVLLLDDATIGGESESDSEAADVLTDTLAGEGVDTFLTLLPLVGFDEVTDADQITIFAPSDEAFTSISADELASIVEDPQSVIDVLQAHVVEGLVTASDLEEMESVQPIRGEAVPVSVDGETIMIGDATVIEAGLEFDGGIVHVIDDVLLLDEL